MRIWRDELPSEELPECCFYCDRPLRRYEHDHLWFRERPADSVTVDHIVPRKDLKRYGARVPERVRALNKIMACFQCNNRKGSADPVEFAQEVGPVAVLRLAQRFIDMGLSTSEIALLRSGRSVIHTIIDKAA